MFGLKKRTGSEEINERPVLGYVDIAGVGKVEVSSVPNDIPSHVIIGDRKIRINRDLYKYMWALTYATSEGRKRIDSIV